MWLSVTSFRVESSFARPVSSSRSDGVIATAYHVVNKPKAIARAVMTLDGQTYPIREVLAADQPNDVVLLKIDAKNLTSVPVSRGDPVGAARGSHWTF